MKFPRKRVMGPRKPKAAHVKLILVKWRDATHLEDDSQEPGTMVVWTMGFQVHRNKNEVALCMELFEDGSKRNITTVPMGMVLNIKLLARIPITAE